MPEALNFNLPEHLASRQKAKRRGWGVQVVSSLIAISCFVSAGIILKPINEIRRERQLVIDPATIKGLPADISLLGKLGTFRALAIDWASIRADRLKEEGKTYEALQLYETICNLAPRFPKVWVNAAWQMAYNISVARYTPEERWQWVRNGIRILRDKGIQYNPKSVTLYKELAWIYWHKIGDFLDDEHMSYKRALAVQMEEVLGAPPVTLRNKEYFDWFASIVNASRDLDAFIVDDDAVAVYVGELADVDLAPNQLLLSFVARHVRPELRVSDLLKDRPTMDPLLVKRLEMITDPDRVATRDRLLAAIRSKVLRERLKFDVDWMFDLMVNQYGPLDWRNAFSHALYWSSVGDRLSKGIARANEADAMNTARFILFSLQQLITRGRLSLWPNFDEPFRSYLDFTPDTRFIPYLYEAYMRLGKEQFGDDPRFVEGTPGPNFFHGFVSNMHVWIQLLYFEGGEENLRQAENYFAWLRRHNPSEDGTIQPRYQTTIDMFALGEILDRMNTYKAAGGVIKSFVARALKHYCLGEQRAASNAVKRAKLCYDYWQKPTRRDINERRTLPPFWRMVADSIEAFMKAQDVGTLFKARLWRELPIQQRQIVYDRLRVYFERLCDAQTPPWDATLAFAEPEGMESFRTRELDVRLTPGSRNAEEGEKDVKQ